MDRDLQDYLHKEFEWLRHLSYRILTDQEIFKEKTMASVQEVKDKVAKLSTDLDAFIAASQGAATAADLDAIGAAVDAVDAKVAPPTP